MPTFSLLDNVHIRKNPWRNTTQGEGEFYFATDPDDLSHLTEYQDDLTEFVQDESNYQECQDLEGMSRNACRARKTSNGLD
jgi:hypothetical protein